MAEEQCPECVARLGDDGLPPCTCAEQNEVTMVTGFDAFRSMRVRPYFVTSADAEPGEGGRSLPSGDEPPRPPIEPRQWPTPDAPGYGPDTGDLSLPGDGDASTRQGPAPARVAAPYGLAALPSAVATSDNLPVHVPRTTTAGTLVIYGDAEPVPPAPSRRRRGLIAAVSVSTAALGFGVLAVATGLVGGKAAGDGAMPQGAHAAPTMPGPDFAVSGPPGSSPGATDSAKPSTSGTPSADESSQASKQGTAAGSSVSPAATASGGSALVLRMGDTGPEVVELQKRLKQACLTCYLLGDEDGIYDRELADAVRNYQKQFDIRGDPKGVYGTNTRRSLESRSDEP